MRAICSLCQTTCISKLVNKGIGRYEFWGAPGFDSQPAVVSNCCEEPCLNEQGHEITVEEFKHYQESEKTYYQED